MGCLAPEFRHHQDRMELRSKETTKFRRKERQAKETHYTHRQRREESRTTHNPHTHNINHNCHTQKEEELEIKL